MHGIAVDYLEVDRKWIFINFLAFITHPFIKFQKNPTIRNLVK